MGKGEPFRNKSMSSHLLRPLSQWALSSLAWGPHVLPELLPLPWQPPDSISFAGCSEQ